MSVPQFKFVTVVVEEHDEIPDGCCMRFKAIGDARSVRTVRYADLTGSRETTWCVSSPIEEGDPTAASLAPTWGILVEDSGAGTCVLVYGGPKGLRLRSLEGGETIAEPYLLLSPKAIVDWEN
jgi:hypothetical protein